MCPLVRVGQYHCSKSMQDVRMSQNVCFDLKIVLLLYNIGSASQSVSRFVSQCVSQSLAHSDCQSVSYDTHSPYRSIDRSFDPNAHLSL